MTVPDIRKAISHATALPEGLSAQELASWTLRGLTEIALFGIAHGLPLDDIDDAVASLGALGKHAHPRFADRLRELRATAGPPTDVFADLAADWSPPAPPKTPSGPAVEGFCRLADLIGPMRDEPPGMFVSAADGHGRTALAERESWRPASLPTTGVVFIPVSVLAALTWRVWTAGSTGTPTVVLVEEMLSPPTMDIWWGIHNGTHLDHLGQLALDGRDPEEIEYSSGLLITESLAMTAELLAGLETENPTTARLIWDGLVERLARLPVPPLDSSRTARRAQNLSDAEFTALPTLAGAYTAGAIELLASGFDHPLIPERLRDAMRCRWDQASDRNPDVAGVLRDLR
ncbi:hypothetical protein [Nocardia rhizosphaerihabitans]|uniref:Uncharacterized protein n=1 Tax=Nocardia rhizosphaerihabitans TaxID=1691570 RepID=A0ABQ2L188_9NOCA|nr:hypothetical protein [Nocardia rhizosphaerihabitans]GGN99380.1 hypothetical protein GCM10011610_67270 [Nocardia rhizosphaerihabitans]